MKLTSVILLEGTGRSFDFRVVALSRREALRDLRRAWRVHVKQTGATPRLEDALDLNYREMRLGIVYRDDAPLMLCELCGEQAGEGGTLCPACADTR